MGYRTKGKDFQGIPEFMAKGAPEFHGRSTPRPVKLLVVGTNQRTSLKKK